MKGSDHKVCTPTSSFPGISRNFSMLQLYHPPAVSSPSCIIFQFNNSPRKSTPSCITPPVVSPRDITSEGYHPSAVSSARDIIPKLYHPPAVSPRDIISEGYRPSAVSYPSCIAQGYHLRGISSPSCTIPQGYHPSAVSLNYSSTSVDNVSNTVYLGIAKSTWTKDIPKYVIVNLYSYKSLLTSCLM